MPNNSNAPMPHYADMERLILGAILVTESASSLDSVSSQLSPGDFYIPSNRQIFESLLRIRGKGKTINLALMEADLTDHGLIDQVGGKAHIATFCDGIPAFSDLSKECEKVKAAAHRRYLIRLSHVLEQKAFDQAEDIDAIVSRLKTKVSEINFVNGSRLGSVWSSDVKPEKAVWLWENRIAMGMVTLLEGMEGIGKSTLCAAIAASVSHGIGLAGMNFTKPGIVLWLSAEDSLSYSITPKLMDAEADLTKVALVDRAFTLDDMGILMLREEMMIRKPQLVIIDPIFAYLKGDGNTSKDTRALTTKLKMLAEEFFCAVMIIRHLNKSLGGGDSRKAGSGSVDWRAAARCVLLAGYDPDIKTKRAITSTKNNFGPLADPIGYELETDKAKFTGCKFYWTGISDLTADKILSSSEIDENERQRRSHSRVEIEEFLIDILSSGPVPVTEAEEQAEAAGISVSYMKKIRMEMGIKAIADRKQTPPRWDWRLPSDFDFSKYSNVQPPLNFDLNGAVKHSSKKDNQETLSFLRNPDIIEEDKGDFEGKKDTILLDPEEASPGLEGQYPSSSKNASKTKKKKELRKKDSKKDLSSLPPDVSQQNDDQMGMKHCRNCGAKLETDGSCEMCKNDMPF